MQNRQLIPIILSIAALFHSAAHPAFSEERSNSTAATRSAVINVSAAYLRAEPQYDAPLETQELMGVVVSVLEKSGYWLRISTPQPYEAWVTDACVTIMDEAALKDYAEAPKYICTALYSKVSDAPARNAAQICDLVAGDLLRMRIAAGGKAVKKGSFLGIILPDGRQGWVEKSALEPYKEWRAAKDAMDAGQKREAVTAWPLGVMGVPYLWGGMTPKGMDCSGMVRMSYLMAGIALPRNCSQIVRLGQEIPFSTRTDAAGNTVWDLSNLLPGDLVFFGSAKGRVSHIGIYLGGGRFVHSSMVVRINSLIKTEPDCYSNAHRLVNVRRVIQ